LAHTTESIDKQKSYVHKNWEVKNRTSLLQTWEMPQP